MSCYKDRFEFDLAIGKKCLSQLAAMPLSRASDPSTSREAAQRVLPVKARHEAAIYGSIVNAGQRGATMKEIAAATGLTEVQVGRRLGNMGERRLIARNEMAPQHFESRSGCAIWRLA